MRTARPTALAAPSLAFTCSRRSKAATNSSPASAATLTQSASRCLPSRCPSCANDSLEYALSLLTPESLDPPQLRCASHSTRSRRSSTGRFERLHLTAWTMRSRYSSPEMCVWLARVRILKECHAQTSAGHWNGELQYQHWPGDRPTASPHLASPTARDRYRIQAPPQPASRFRRHRAGDRRPEIA